MTTDAANWGWGAILDSDHLSGQWKQHQLHWHSNRKELWTSGWELRKNDVLRLDCVYWIDKLLKVSAGRRSTQQCLNQLFITTRGKTAGASASTIRGWIRTAFQTIGIGNPPGSTRSAVASYNCSVYKLSVEEVLARGNWKSSSTFIKHYFKDIDMTQRPQTNGSTSDTSILPFRPVVL
nr:unnamed protein product [Callosobruchus chinensis]